MTTKTKITMIRHGETDGNRNGIVQGWADYPLNATGRSQSERLAARIKTWQEPPTAIVASTLKRAAETAAIIGEAIGVPPSYADDLREMSFGDCDGMSGAAIAEQHGDDFLPRYFRDWTSTSKTPGGESLAQALERFTQAIEGLARDFAGQHIAVVSHGLVLRSYCFQQLGMPSGQQMFRFPNTGIAQVTISRESCYFGMICDSAHLE